MPLVLAFATALRGPFVDGGFATSGTGDALMFEVGANYTAIRSLGERRWLLQYDLAAAGKFGWMGNQHPFTFLLGPRASASIELGRRFLAENVWSPYVGARLGSNMQILEHPGLAADALDTFNESQAGTRADGLVRIDAGASMLDETRSLLLVGFVQEAFQSRSVYTHAYAFTQIGLGVRFDLQQAFIGELEGVWGVTPNRTELGYVDQTTRVGFGGNIRQIFANGIWLGLRVLVQRDTDTLAYPTRTYGTGNAPLFDASIHFGWSP